MVDQYLYGKDNGALFDLWKSRKQAETIIISVVYIIHRLYPGLKYNIHIDFLGFSRLLHIGIEHFFSNLKWCIFNFSNYRSFWALYRTLCSQPSQMYNIHVMHDWGTGMRYGLLLWFYDSVRSLCDLTVRLSKGVGEG